MPRYRLTVAYEGTDFHGWQKQAPADAGPDALRTVQGVLEAAVREAVREPVSLLGASRTDAGVHARGQVAAFTSESSLEPARMRAAINARLPADVQVRRVQTTSDDFNPISHAIRKGYRYRIAHGRFTSPLFVRRLTTWTARALDSEAMDEAARHLVGEHDFTSFTRLHHGRESAVRTIDACRVTATGPRRLRIDVSGNGFLYNMVRIIAGTLVEIGYGKKEPAAIPEILAAADRTAAGPTLPPEGLCLMWIEYPE